MKKITKYLFIFLLVFVLGLVSCNKKNPQPEKSKLNEVEFSTVPTTLDKGEEVVVTFTKQEGVSVVWTSTNANVVSVVEGKITALAAGTATVKALFTLGEESKSYEFTITVNETEFSITYQNDGSYEGTTNKTTFTKEDLPITLVNPTKEGYNFLGWYLNGELVTSIPVGTKENIVLVAEWEEVEVEPLKISYILNGGKNPSDAPSTFMPGVGVTLPIPSKDGYNFLGWTFTNTSDDYVTEVGADVERDVKVYAQWEKIVVHSAISYVLNEGVFKCEEVVTYEEGVGIELPTPERDGYEFLGWTYSETSTDYFTKISSSKKGDVTVYAQWKLITKFKINYSYEEGDLPRRQATTMQEIEDEFWPAFAAWYGNTGDLQAFRTKVLAAWASGKDGGYKLYLPSGQGQIDEAYFINHPDTDKYWVEWMNAIDSQVKKINGSQEAWGSPYVGYLRISAFFNGNTSLWTEERRLVVYNSYYAATPLVSEYNAGDEIELVELVINDGRTFLGWYDDKGNKVSKITSDMTGELNLTAMWSASTPATSFELNKVDRLGKLDSYELTWVLLPADTTNKKIIFTSSDESILSIDKHNVMYGHEVGKVVVTYQVLANPDLSGSFEVEVFVDPYIDATYETSSVITVGESIKINATVEAAIGKVLWSTSDPKVATVDASGKVTGVGSGYVEITASMEGKPEVSLTLGITVLSQEEAVLYKVLTDAHNSEVYYVPLLNVAYDYDTSVACSASDLLFNWEYKINEDYFITPNRPKMSSIEFITVHYSGMPLAHQDGEVIAKSLYNGFHGENWGGTSWHYSTGNDGIYHSMADTDVAWHAGDGTGTKFQWINTGVPATSNTKPTFKVVPNANVSTKYSYEVNGVVTNIAAPGNYKLTFFGPTWKVENGYYYMGNTYYSSSYGYISSRGGNLNSIGIESACNYGSDLWLTYHYTAQLVSRLLVQNNLDITRVQGHHTFSGKDCPQSLLEGEGELWYKFIELIEAELALYQTMGDYTISCKSSNPDVLSDNGRIVNVPNYTETVTYTLTIKNNKTGETKELKLSSVVHGLYTF